MFVFEICYYNFYLKSISGDFRDKIDLDDLKHDQFDEIVVKVCVFKF